MDPLRKNARLAGLLYLVVVITGPFLLMYVPGKLFVAGDATATAKNIPAHEGLFRAYIVTGIVGELFFVATILALYRLIEKVGPQVAAVMVIAILIDVPLAVLGVANEVAVLAFVRGGRSWRRSIRRSGTRWRPFSSKSTGRGSSSRRSSGGCGSFRSAC